MASNETREGTGHDIDPAEMRISIEFGTWGALVMTPTIWWLQCHQYQLTNSSYAPVWLSSA